MCKRGVAIRKAAFILLLVFSLSAYAARGDSVDVVTEEECIARAESLRRDQAANPFDALGAVEALVELSRIKGWQRAYLYASTYKLELYVKQDSISAAHVIHEELLPLSTVASDPVITARLMMANLKIKFALNDIKNVSDLHSPLRQRARISTDPSEVGEIYLALGLSLQNNYRLGEATKLYQRAYEVFDSIDDEVSKALVLNSLADAYRNLGDTELAVEYFKLALEIHRRVGDQFGASVVLYNLGNVHVASGELVLAVEALSEALQLSEKIDDTIGMAWAQSSLAEVALKKEDWETAVTLLQQAQPVFAQAGDKQSELDCMLYQAAAHLGAGDIDSAEKMLALGKSSLPVGKSVSSYYEFYKTDAQVGAAKGDYKRAYASLERKYNWVIAQHKRDTEKQVQRYKTEFDTQLKDKQNEVLQKENELQELRIQRQRRGKRLWILAVLLVVALLLFVGTLLFLQTKNRNRFKALAMRDHLTDSPNRRAVLQFAQERFDEAVHASRSVIIAIVDLDNFKKLNDSFGHEAGDEALKNFALACSSSLRQQDGYGRYGGEEWLLVLSDIDVIQVARVFERLRTNLNQCVAKGIPADYEITFSMGVAKYDRSVHKNIDEMIKQADERLYVAKENGRNRFES